MSESERLAATTPFSFEEWSGELERVSPLQDRDKILALVLQTMMAAGLDPKDAVSSVLAYWQPEDEPESSHSPLLVAAAVIVLALALAALWFPLVAP